MEKHYKKILKDTEERVASRLRAQEMDEKSPCYGGFYDTNRMVQAKYTIICVEPMITLYCNPDSRYYRNPLLAWRAELGLAYIRSVQHENGLFDYVTCNFLSAPDTANPWLIMVVRRVKSSALVLYVLVPRSSRA